MLHATCRALTVLVVLGVLAPLGVAAQSSFTATPVGTTAMVVQAGGSPLQVSITGPMLIRIDSAAVRRAGGTAGVHAVLGSTGGRQARTSGLHVSLTAAREAAPANDYVLILWVQRNSHQVTTFTVSPPPPVPASVTFSPGEVVGGFPVEAAVALDRAAPPGGTPVHLSTGAGATAPPTIIVRAGQTRATFEVETERTSEARSVTLEASASGESRAAELRLIPYVAAVTRLDLSKYTAGGGETVTGTVRLASPPPAGGVAVPLAASLSLATTSRELSLTYDRSLGTPTIVGPAVSLPSSVTVEAGRTSATFAFQVQEVSASQQIRLTAGTPPNAFSRTLTVEPPCSPRYVGLRVEGPDQVPEGGQASYRAVAEFCDGTSSDVTPYVSRWTLENGAGSTLQGGVLSTPAQLPYTAAAVVTAMYGEPDGITRLGSRQVTLRTWGLEIEGPDEVTESDVDNHLQAGAVQYGLVVVEADGSRTPASGVWSYRQLTNLGANILPDGTFGVFAATRDLQTEIRSNYSRNGIRRTAEKPITVRTLPIKLIGLRVLDGPMEVDPGTSAQFKAQAQFRGRTDLLVPATWELVSGPAGSTLDPVTGLFTAGGESGSAQVRATYERDGIVKAATWGFSVKAGPSTILTYLAIRPPQPNAQWPDAMLAGQSRQYEAEATYQNMRKEVVQAEWSVSTPRVQISAQGLLTTSDVEADLPVTVTAKYASGGVTKTATNDVVVRPNPATTLTDVRIAWSPDFIYAGQSQQYRAEARYLDGRREEIQPEWSVSTSRVQISADGLVTTGEVQAELPFTITASYTSGPVTKSAKMDVRVLRNYPRECELEAESGSPHTRITPGSSRQYRLRVEMADGSTRLITDQAEWEAAGQWFAPDPEDPFYETTPTVTISSSGLLTVGPFPPIPPGREPALIGTVRARYDAIGGSCDWTSVNFSAY